jgi:cytochrome c5
MSDPHVEEAHTGPIKTPKQLLIWSFFAFVVPVFAIILLVWFVLASPKPAGSADDRAHYLGGVTTDARERGVAERLQKVGMVEIRDANRPLRAGEEVYKAQCTACHAAGAAGAPKSGDQAAWGPRIKTGYEALLNSALKGKGAMGAQGGGDFSDLEIGRAVVYMVNAAGGKMAEPAAPAADAATAEAAPAK